ncbi:FAD/NAD-P-binding domain-containing protein [Favolaschia claudopus]|uniref:FAD/NAD-P-binding domain-containing protein n=1 Tax=Favolaschia claudopus TaxID=2862362 RepID=A0AAW0DVW4_9AGAR
MDNDASAIAESWLQSFGAFLQSGDLAGATSCFAPHGYLRDVLIFTWNNRTLVGHSQITTYLNDTLDRVSITEAKLDTREHLAPSFGHVTPMAFGVSSGFTFETAVGHGEGHFSLVQNEDCEWKAIVVSVMLADIRGHEESGPEKGVYGGHTLAWHDVHRERSEAIERDPHVLIIGAGQTGLNVGARFRQMNIPSLIIETTARVGDMLYQSFPDNWPTYTPRDKLADWLEQYAISQDLVIWTNSRALPTPTWNPVLKRWSLTSFIAAGALGVPLLPVIQDATSFRGDIIHAAAYDGGKNFAGKRVMVVGAGNSSADICQDLAFHGASEVTMLQRSSTCVISVETTARLLSRLWPAHRTMWAQEKETHKGLREAGLSLTMGKDGSGQYPMIFERFGGLDVGAADLIRSGKIKIKHGVEIERFTGTSAIFTDGSSIALDVVIFATGYRNELINQTSTVWGVDEEGELNGCYRPSGHPGFWYAAGDFPVSRFYSKQFGELLIKVSLFAL